MTRLHLSAMLAPVLLAVSPTQGEPKEVEPMSLTLRVYNYAGATPGVVHSAERKAARIFDCASIEIVWLDCPTSPEQIVANGACSENLGPDHLILNLLPLSMSKKYRLKREAFGFALPTADGRPGNNLSLFFERVSDLAYHGAMDTTFEDSQAIILGHVIAHEVGHLLLGRNSHSGSGIMSFPWNKRTLTSMARGRLLFSSGEQESIRKEIARRITRASEPTRREQRSTAQDQEVGVRDNLIDRKDETLEGNVVPPTIAVRLYNLAHLDKGDLSRATTEASEIFRRAGVRLSWANCAEPEPEAACRQVTGPSALNLRLMNDAMGPPDLPEGVFGFALMSTPGRFARTANVYVGRVSKIADGRKYRRAVILGAMIAHEIGHLLLGRGSHSKYGLMSLPWGPKVLTAANRGMLSFSKNEARQLRRAAMDRVAAYNLQRFGVRGNQDMRMSGS